MNVDRGDHDEEPQKYGTVSPPLGPGAGAADTATASTIYEKTIDSMLVIQVNDDSKTQDDDQC